MWPKPSTYIIVKHEQKKSRTHGESRGTELFFWSVRMPPIRCTILNHKQWRTKRGKWSWLDAYKKHTLCFSSTDWLKYTSHSWNKQNNNNKRKQTKRTVFFFRSKQKLERICWSDGGHWQRPWDDTSSKLIAFEFARSLSSLRKKKKKEKKPNRVHNNAFSFFISYNDRH